MKVSVIVPVYNVEEYLDECLKSLVNQTLKEIEILVVNDGSPDNSQAIIDKYVSEYPGLVQGFVKENGGLSSARNFAIPHARGEYIGFVDSDDWVDPEMYEEMYNKAKSEGADVVVCDMSDAYPDKVIYHKCSEFTNKFRQTQSACNKLFKAELVKNDLFVDGIWYEDLNSTAIKFMQTDKIARVHKDFYHCNCRETSIMNNNNAPKNLDIIKVFNNIKGFAEKNGLYSKYKNDIDYMIIDHILITTINRVAQQTHPEKARVIKELREYVKKEVPDLKKLQVFKDMPLNRRVIANLNLLGLHKVSKGILSIKSKI